MGLSAGEIITVEKDRVVLALRKLGLSLQRREELYRAMGASMLVSIRRTFREQGSPANSWVPLSPNTVKRDPKKYGSGHKLLIDKAILLNSITFAVFSLGVTIGTNVVYAGVQNFGSKDRTGGPYSPQARLAGREAAVPSFRYKREREIHYSMQEITRADGVKVHVPRSMRMGRHEIVNSAGKKQIVLRLFEGPKQQIDVKVGAHTRFQNIPARPFMIFRPEDPARLRSLAVQFANKSKADAGLAGA